MIYVIRNEPREGSDPVRPVPNWATFHDAHGVALFMWGKDCTEWSFALTGQPYRPMTDICSDSLITTIERNLNHLLQQGQS